MAKQIKAIKCPQCGSTFYTISRKIGEDDLYKCNNCGTEYFLDSDDININVTHNNARPISNNPDDVQTVKRIIIGIVIFIMIVFLSNMCRSFFSSSNPKPQSRYNTYSNPTSKPDNKEYSKSIYNNILFETSSKQPMVLTIYKKYYKGSSSDDNYYWEVTNLFTSKTIKTEKISAKNFSSSDIKNAAGNIYMFINKRQIYRFDKNTFEMVNLTDEIINKRPEFSSGIAELRETDSSSSALGLRIMTNLGKEYYYYPLIDKIYTSSSEHFNAQRGMKTLLPGAKDETYYTFSIASDDYKDQPIQLFRITYKSNNGGPERFSSPKWTKDYTNGQSGIFYITERTPFTKRLFPLDSRVTSYADITPGKLYFSPAVLYYDETNVIIKYRPTVAEDAPVILQCLNADNGQIIWSQDISSETAKIKNCIKTPKGYIFVTNNYKIFLLGNDGKIQKDLSISEKGKDK